MKVVIDTNILIDAWKDDFSYQRRIIDEVLAGNIEAFASHKIWREYNLILNRLVNDQKHYDFMNDFIGRVEMVEPRMRVQVVQYDREDNKFFNCALEAEAEYIISNDMDLREVGEYRGVKVATPEDFWNKYKAGDESEWKNWMKGILGK
jgi:uncharacterized protein